MQRQSRKNAFHSVKLAVATDFSCYFWHNSIPCFSTLNFEYEFIVSKTKLGKNYENLAMIMNQKG